MAKGRGEEEQKLSPLCKKKEGRWCGGGGVWGCVCGGGGEAGHDELIRNKSGNGKPQCQKLCL